MVPALDGQVVLSASKIVHLGAILQIAALIH
jgi:hypothetical protein